MFNPYDESSSESDCRVTVAHATASAVLLELEDGNKVWFPKSTLSDEGEVTGESCEGDSGAVIIGNWILKDKGLI